MIIADEPTTALDVTVQAQILEVLQTALKETGAAMVLITHDLGVVAGIADRVLVMYAGRPVEIGSVEDIYYEPRMPYTLGLLGSLPRLDAPTGSGCTPILGAPPSLVNMPPGCPFAPALPAAHRRVRQGGATAAPGRRRAHAACIRTERGGTARADVFARPHGRRPGRGPGAGSRRPERRRCRRHAAAETEPRRCAPTAAAAATATRRTETGHERPATERAGGCATVRRADPQVAA